ncbi:unnamed protein product [Fusarium graminearum]|uniref:Uncharacterized protein n=1 Tax=Gibberella zeae TaxID=5518 RepID=A0A4U9FGG9_GIBZA|nr:unnamed protein product [Fusarium graminearum]CAG2016314.1 unnamed protein product [Fusarium graminearum]VTO92866.1 unnamed protein product [Fusarium graminearum]
MVSLRLSSLRIDDIWCFPKNTIFFGQYVVITVPEIQLTSAKHECRAWAQMGVAAYLCIAMCNHIK